MEWIPSDFIVVGSDTPREQYKIFVKNQQGDFFEKIIFVTKTCDRTGFIHEYGHLILDDFMRKNSAPWQYNIAWSMVDFEDIKTVKELHLESLENLRIFLGELKEKRLNPPEDTGDDYLAMLDEIIDVNIPGKLEQYENLISKLGQAQEIQENSPVPFDQFMHFEVLKPFHELFAETFVALFTGNWSVSKEKTISFLEENENLIVLPEAPDGNRDTAVSNYLLCRDFPKNLSHYSFRGWEKTNEYCHFIPLRSFIRETMETTPSMGSGDMVQALGHAIIHVYENELIPKPENLDRSLQEKNKSLLESLRSQLSLVNQSMNDS